MALSFGSTLGLYPGEGQDAGLSSLGALGFGSSLAPDDASSPLFDSDGYPVSIGPDDWGVVSALGLDNYSRLGRLLGTSSAFASGDTGGRALDDAQAVRPPPPPSVALGTQPVAGIAPTDLASLAPFVAPQLSARGGANDEDNEPYPGVGQPPAAVTALGADPAAPVAAADASALTDPPTFALDSDYRAQPGDSAWLIAQQAYGSHDIRAGIEALIRSNGLRLDQSGVPIIHSGQRLTLPDLSLLDQASRAELDRAGGRRLDHIAQIAALGQPQPDLFAQTPSGTAAFQPASAIPNVSLLDALGPNAAQDSPPWVPRIGPPPPPLPYLTAALREGDRGYGDAKARFAEVASPRTIQQAAENAINPAGVALSALALGAEPGGDFVGELLRPLLPGDSAGSRSLRDAVGGSIVNLPGFATGEGEAAEGIYWFPDLWAGDGSIYVGQTGKGWARPDQWVRSGRANPASITFREVRGGRQAREIAEHNRIQEITGGQRARNSSAVSNRRDPIGLQRRIRLGIPHPRE